MSVPVMITIRVQLDGTPDQVAVTWTTPHGELKTVTEELDPGATAEEAWECAQTVRRAVEHDPF